MRPSLPLLAFLLIGCAPPSAQQRSYTLRVRVESDPGQGLSGVPLHFGANKIGTTGPDGTARVAVIGREGQRVPLRALCPETHSAPSSPTTVVLRTYLEAQVPELEISCPPRTRKLAVVVKAKNGGGLDLVHRGKTIGHTDENGIAHLLLEGPPGEAYEVALDTSSHPTLHPQNPGARFVIASADEALLFDPELEHDLPDPPRRRRRPKKPKSNLPQRIR